MPTPMSHAPNPDAASSVGKKVRTFYEDCSFPDYDEWDMPGTLIAKAQRSGFAKWLDEQVAFGSRVLEVGCGTGQLAVFLSLADRRVVATDFSMGSLHKGWSFARSSATSTGKRCGWADQYYHPHETQHTVDEVLGWFEESGVEFISAIPPVAFGVPINAPLFRPQPKGGRLGHWLKQLRWILSLGHEGGLFVMIGRRKSR